MVQLHHFHSNVQEYYRRGKENLFPDLWGCPNPCCHYEGRLRRHGFYTRNALTIRASYVIVIQRYYCPACRKTVSLLPSFLAPHFQYTMACVLFILHALAMARLSFARIAEQVNCYSGRKEFSRQQVGFYRRRLLENHPLIVGFFGLYGLTLPPGDPGLWPQVFLREARVHFHLTIFSLDYFTFQARHFLAKS